MASVIGCGPPWRINGPLPLPRPYSLLSAAAAAYPAVQIVPDADGEGVERWGNGIDVYPYPADIPQAWTDLSSGSTPGAKVTGEAIRGSQFGAFTVVASIKCSTFGIFGADPQENWPELFAARAEVAFAAVESMAVEYELMTGAMMTSNPHLSDALAGWSGDALPLQGFPNGDTATSVVGALALLENSIAVSGRQGVIHCTPGFVIGGVGHFQFTKDTGVLRTFNGTTIIPGSGYALASAQGNHPHTHPAPTGTQEWVYATGPIDIRRSPLITLPDPADESLWWQAVDRANNTIEFQVERYYNVVWDGAVQAAVLADRCLTTPC